MKYSLVTVRFHSGALVLVIDRRKAEYVFGDRDHENALRKRMRSI